MRNTDDDVVGFQRRLKSPGRGGSRDGGGSRRIIHRVIMDGLQSVVMDVPFVIVVKIPYLVVRGAHAVFHLKRTNPWFLEFLPGMTFHPHEVVGVVTSEILVFVILLFLFDPSSVKLVPGCFQESAGVLSQLSLVVGDGFGVDYCVSEFGVQHRARGTSVGQFEGGDCGRVM